jgi:hypothetical protein
MVELMARRSSDLSHAVLSQALVLSILKKMVFVRMPAMGLGVNHAAHNQLA